MAVNVDNYLLRDFVVKPGTPSSWSFFISLTNVLAGGEKETLVKILDQVLLICHVMNTVCIMGGENSVIFIGCCRLR